MHDEQERQAALDDFKLDAFAETAYDDITRMAAEICATPVALVTFIDGDRQWFKSRFGTDITETPRELAFCAHAIEDAQHVMVVEDASRDPRFANNPMVTDAPGVRFYAGAPLVTSSGHALGTVCVLDVVPRTIDPAQIETLRFLAQQVITRLEERRAEAQSSAASTTAPAP